MYGYMSVPFIDVLVGLILSIINFKIPVHITSRPRVLEANNKPESILETTAEGKV